VNSIENLTLLSSLEINFVSIVICFPPDDRVKGLLSHYLATIISQTASKVKGTASVSVKIHQKNKKSNGFDRRCP
jgi:hypothetical protein